MANKRLNAVITIGGAVAGSLGSAFGAVRGHVDKLGSAVQQLASRQRELNAELSKIGRDGARGSELRAHYARMELDAIGKQIALLKQRQAIENARSLNREQRADIRGKIIGTAATAAVIGAPIGKAIKDAAEFDYEMQLIGNTAQMTRGEIAELRKGIIEDSRKVAQSATSMQKGMGFLIAAGMEAKLARQFLVDIGRTATATNSDINDLSKMVFTLNDSLKIQPEGMQAAIDTLAQAGKEGNVELRDMAGLLPVLGSGFVALKMEGREAAATMGAALQIARKGAATAEQAGTNFENFLNKIMSPETRKKAEKMGLDIEKVIRTAQKKGQNPFEAAIESISKVTKGGDQRLIGDLFQDMQVQSFLRPVIQQWDKYKEIKAKALGADGVIEHDFALMMQTTKQQVMELANAFGRLGIAIGATLTSSTGDKSTSLSARIGQLTEFIEANKELVGVTIKVVGGLFAARLAFLGVAYAVNLVRGAWLAAQALWLAAPLLLNPVGLAIAGVATAAFLIYKYWEPIKEFFGTVWAGVKGEFVAVYDWIVGKVASLFEIIGRAKSAVAGWFSGSSGAQGAGTDGYDAMGNSTGAGLPDVPKPAARGGTTVQDNSQNNYTFMLPPGSDTKALADEIERRTRQRAGIRARSSLVDGVGAQ